MSTYSLRISSITALAKDVKLIEFEELPFNYKSGQFLTFIIQQGKEEVRRSFSLVSCPELNEKPAICVRRIPNGVFSRYLVDDAKPGDTLICTGAAGLFTIPENQTTEQLYFFAAGTGIAPILPLLKQVLIRNQADHVTLIYSSKSENKTLFKNEIDALSAQYASTFEVKYIWSESTFPEHSRLQRVLLEKILNETRKVELSRARFYLCGPYEYMRMISFSLRLSHVPDTAIRTEQFLQGKPVPVLQPPNTEKHEVTLHLNGMAHSFSIQYPQTILKASKAAGIHIPYSCEFGRCGSCVAKCTDGKIWMSNNEVLTDNDLRNGFILTCVAYPLTDAIIDFEIE